MSFEESVKPGVEIVGADGVHVGVVDALDGDRIRLKRKDVAHGGESPGARYISVNNIASTEGGKLWLSANADLVALFEEETQSGRPVRL
ncbi:DUF2171 domain-containing protein [Paracoccus aminophilus]|uniref:DUF2171 domain-containing protein n=1 Tax=Paracoccus aminophilus JCM 7686 TaxID=1367847 RepID=S5YA75_PARAH|nr:DUF2171 domain-containing protein [Paracoccus aminophilus]AGT08318.1 hypothetical protein JCM7686_1209 [Paracoccus aminophilus JCM 7686]